MKRAHSSLVGAVVLLIATVATVAISVPVEATAAPRGVAGSPTVRALSARLATVTHGTARFAVRATTGDVTFIGGSPAHPLQPATDDTGDSAEAAREFVDGYGEMFGVDDATTDLTQLSVFTSDTGDAVRFQQRFASLPVIAGQIAVQVDDTGAVVSATGEASPQLDIPVTANISSDAAAATALSLTAKYDAISPVELVTSAPTLSIYDPSLLGIDDTDSAGPRVVWRVDVRSAMGDIDRLVLVDAGTGTVALQFSQREDAKSRAVCDNNNNRVLPESCNVTALSTLTESTYASLYSPASPDAKLAYDLAGVTYDFYNSLGRDSIDGLGMQIVSTVRYCPPTGVNNCTYANAYWNGEQIVYGRGYSKADDVVGHELTHGVTQFTSGLFYYADAGAINESISDVMGELIDQANGGDADWTIGEDLSIGALRSMSNPPSFGDPDRMTSPLFSGSRGDNHGVHTNSGVNNKAAYLTAHGETFNGQTVAGIGTIKTAQIYYKVQSLLTPGSDYVDLANALPQACMLLTKPPVAGITAADCAEVSKSVLATEMAQRATTAGASLTAAVCDSAGQRVLAQFSDNMETDNLAWASTTSGSATGWSYSTASSQSGVRAWHVEDLGGAGAAVLTLQNPVPISPDGTSYLRFDHSFSTDADYGRQILYEGGVVEYSVDSGAWRDIATLGAITNGYTDTISSGFANPLQGRSSFGYDSPNYESTRIDVSSLGGHSVRFRFILGTDSIASGAPGWFLDDVSVYACAVAPSPPTGLSAVAGSAAAIIAWTAPMTGSSPITGYTVTPNIGGVDQPGVMVANVTSYVMTGLTVGATYTFTVAATNAAGSSPPSAPSAAVVPFSGFTSFVPARLLETRPERNTIDGQFNGIGLRDPASTTALTVLGRGGISGDAAAVVLNVTVTEAQAPGYVTVYPCGGTVPTASNVNYVAGSTIPNAVVVKVGHNGQVCLFTQSAVHLVVDANGYFPAGASLTPLVPGRLLDSRPSQPTVDGQSSGIGVRPAGSVTQIPVSGRAGVPSDAAAVALNVTVSEAQDIGYITVYPCGTNPPVASNLNYVAGSTIANAAITKIGAGGMVCVYTQAPIQLIVDVNGFVPIAATLVPMVPARILDTRAGHSTADGLSNGIGTRDAGSVTVVQVTGRATVPLTATAVVLNVTVTESAAPGYVTVYPCGSDPPTASNLNYGIGTTIANAVITRLGADGTVCIFTQSATHLVADVNAFFTG